MNAEASRYVEGDTTNNSVLLMVLRRFWEYRCYWCREPTIFKFMEIDHMIPRTAAPERREELIKSLAIPEDFDLDRPANLAPICRPCNNEKSNQDHVDSARMLSLLKRAANLEAKVDKAFVAFAGHNSLVASLAQIVAVDVQDAAIRELLRPFVEDLALTAAALDTQALGNGKASSTPVNIGLECGPVDLSVSWRCAGAVLTLEEISGCNMSAALESAIDSLVEELRSRWTFDLARAFGPNGPFTIEEDGAKFASVEVAIDTVRVGRSGTEITFEFVGAARANADADLAGTASDGGSSDAFNGEVEATASYEFSVMNDLAQPPCPPSVENVKITGWAATTLFWNADTFDFFIIG